MPITTPYDHDAELRLVILPAQSVHDMMWRAAEIAKSQIEQAAYREGWAACVKALKEADIEWILDLDNGKRYCPCCDGCQEPDGHEVQCALAAILKSGEETPHA